MRTPRQLATALVADAKADHSQFICLDTVDQVADWLRREDPEQATACPFTGDGGFAHTRHWCGYETCRDS